MALESVFVCPRTITALRSGPLGGLLDGYCDWMLECGFKRTTVRKNLANKKGDRFIFLTLRAHNDKPFPCHEAHV